MTLKEAITLILELHDNVELVEIVRIVMILYVVYLYGRECFGCVVAAWRCNVTHSFLILSLSTIQNAPESPFPTPQPVENDEKSKNLPLYKRCCNACFQPSQKINHNNELYYTDDFNDFSWSCSTGTSDENGIWMNNSDQAGTIMACLVWLLLGALLCVCVVVVVGVVCVVWLAVVVCGVWLVVCVNVVLTSHTHFTYTLRVQSILQSQWHF